MRACGVTPRPGVDYVDPPYWGLLTLDLCASGSNSDRKARRREKYPPCCAVEPVVFAGLIGKYQIERLRDELSAKTILVRTASIVLFVARVRGSRMVSASRF
jgi:hypothetical protein